MVNELLTILTVYDLIKKRWCSFTAYQMRMVVNILQSTDNLVFLDMPRNFYRRITSGSLGSQACLLQAWQSKEVLQLVGCLILFHVYDLLQLVGLWTSLEVLDFMEINTFLL